MKLSPADESDISESDSLVVVRRCRFPRGSMVSDNIRRDQKQHTTIEHRRDKGRSSVCGRRAPIVTKIDVDGVSRLTLCMSAIPAGAWVPSEDCKGVEVGNRKAPVHRGV